MFSTLTDVRALARARAVEDYEYFVEAVVGRRTVFDCGVLWEAVKEGRVVEFVPSETFLWLFPELVKRAA